MTIDYEDLDISQLVKMERKQRSLNFEEVALGVGTSAGYIFRIEKERVKPRIYIVEKIIKYFSLGDTELALYRYSNQSQTDTETIIEKEGRNNLTNAKNVLYLDVHRKNKLDKKSME